MFHVPNEILTHNLSNNTIEFFFRFLKSAHKHYSMSSSTEVPRDLACLLGPDTFSQIPTNAQGVLQQVWTSHTDTLKTNLEKVKEDLTRTQTVKV